MRAKTRSPSFPYRYLFLDWAETLSMSHFWEHCRDPQHSHHALYTHAQSALFGPRADPALIGAWLRGRLSSEEVISAVYPRPAFDPDHVLRELRRGCAEMRFVSPAIPTYLGRIRAHGVRVYIATDNMDTFTRWTVPGLALSALVDGWLNSADLGCTKADADPAGESAFFGPFLRAQAIGPGESLLLDDNADPAFGALLRCWGIDSIAVAPGTGLPAALERILAALDEQG